MRTYIMEIKIPQIKKRTNIMQSIHIYYAN